MGGASLTLPERVRETQDTADVTDAPPSWRRIGDLASPVVLVAAVIAIVAMVDAAIRSVPVYLTPDAGHYLEDARALFGDGSRDNRHLPLFPFVLGVIGWFSDDLVALQVTITLVLTAAVAAFVVFIRGRLGSRLGESVGAVVFALSAVYAEAIGWYGGAMVLGVVFAAVAMRALEALFREPQPRRAVIAGVAVGTVGLTHPFWVLVTAQASALVLLASALHALVTRRARGDRVVHHLSCLALAACAALVVMLPVRRFYVEVQNPVELSVSTTNLGLLENWAFREFPPFGVVVLVGLLCLIVAARRLAGDAGARLALWATSIAVVVLVNLVVVSGDPTYTNRILYAVPLLSGTAVAALMAWIVSATDAVAGRRFALVVAAALTVIVCLTAGQMFDERLDAAIPYFNHVAQLELEAVNALRDDEGAVLVAPRSDDDAYAAGLYAWMFEGLLRRRAIGPAYAGVNLFARGISESDDAARIVAGAEVVERGSVQVGRSPGTGVPAHISVRAEDVWSRAFSVGDGVEVRPRAGVDGGITLDLPGSMDAALSLVRLPTGIPKIEMRDGGVRLTVRVGGETAVLDVEARGARFERAHDVPGATRLRVVAHDTTSLALDVRALRDRGALLPVRRYSDSALLAKYRFGYVLAWSGTSELQQLEHRDCFERLRENDVVTTLEVRPECRQARAGPSP